MKDRVVLVGGYPPPHGGYTVHVERLYRALQDRFEVEVIDLYGAPQQDDDRSIHRCGSGVLGLLRALVALRRCPASIVHFHVTAMGAFLFAAYPLLGVLRPDARPIITIHGGSFISAFETGPAWRRAFMRNVLGRFYRVIAVNHDQRQFLERLGVDAGRIRVIPAFLPPVSKASPRAREAVASLRDCDRVLVTSGGPEPYYGYHVILDALERLADAGRNTGLIICVYDKPEGRYFTEIAKRASKRGRCVIVRGLDSDEFAWILENSDIYVRATDRDGDAVAVREALWFGKDVIASNCVGRPADALLFHTDDACSLAEALQHSRKRSDSKRHGALSAPIGEDGLQAVLDLYRGTLEA